MPRRTLRMVVFPDPEAVAFWIAVIGFMAVGALVATAVHDRSRVDATGDPRAQI